MPLVSSNLLNPLGAALQSKINLSPLGMSTANSTSSSTQAPATYSAPKVQALPGNVLSGMSIPDYQAMVAKNRAVQTKGYQAPGSLPVKPLLPVTTAGKAPVASSLPLINPNAGMFGQGSQAPAQTITAENPQGTPSTTFTGLISKLEGLLGTNAGIGQKAADIAAGYGKKIADVGQKGADAAAGYQTTGTTPVGEGNAAVVKQTTAAEQAALAAGESAELQGTGQELTAASQSASALGAAASNAKPQVGDYGQTFYNPLTQSSLGSGEFSSAIDQYAKMAAAGQLDGIPSAITGNPVLNAEVLARAKQINPGFNYNTAAGTGSAQQNLTLGGMTAEQQANIPVYQKALDNLATLTNQLGNVDQLGDLLVSTATTGGINPSNARYANQTIAQIRTQLSSAEQAQYDSTLATLKSKISALLQIGGADIPSEATAQANKVLDGSIALSALPAVLQQIAQEGQIVVKNQSDIASKAYSNIQSGGASSGSGGGSMYDF